MPTGHERGFVLPGRCGGVEHTIERYEIKPGLQLQIPIRGDRGARNRPVGLHRKIQSPPRSFVNSLSSVGLQCCSDFPCEEGGGLANKPPSLAAFNRLPAFLEMPIAVAGNVSLEDSAEKLPLPSTITGVRNVITDP